MGDTNKHRLRVAAESELSDGTGLAVKAGDTAIALFRVEGRCYAIANTCPHRGGPLAEGELEGTTVTCPWHAWQFDLKTGESLTDESRVQRYEVQVTDGAVLVAVD